MNQWLGASRTAITGGDPLTDLAARNGAVLEYRAWLSGTCNISASTVRDHLAAINHFYAYLGLGAATSTREQLTATMLEKLEVRDAVINLLLAPTGLHADEIAALNVGDVAISTQEAAIHVHGRAAGTPHCVRVDPATRAALHAWLDARSSHRGAGQTPALFLSSTGQRVSKSTIWRIRRGLHGVDGAAGHDGALPAAPRAALQATRQATAPSSGGSGRKGRAGSARRRPPLPAASFQHDRPGADNSAG